MTVAAATKVGKVVQVIGPVVDIEFDGGQLPEIYNAVQVTGKAGNDGPIVAIVSGGNIDLKKFCELIG